MQQAIRDCPSSVSIHMLQYLFSMSVFKTSDYNTLIDTVRSVHSCVALASTNQLAASELNNSLSTHSTTLYNTATSSTATRSLQQEYQHVLWEQQLMQLQCDTLLRTLQVERSSGNVEKAVAIVQVCFVLCCVVANLVVLLPVFKRIPICCFILTLSLFYNTCGAGLQSIRQYRIGRGVLYVLGQRARQSRRGLHFVTQCVYE